MPTAVPLSPSAPSDRPKAARSPGSCSCCWSSPVCFFLFLRPYLLPSKALPAVLDEDWITGGLTAGEPLLSSADSAETGQRRGRPLHRQPQHLRRSQPQHTSPVSPSPAPPTPAATSSSASTARSSSASPSTRSPTAPTPATTTPSPSSAVTRTSPASSPTPPISPW